MEVPGFAGKDEELVVLGPRGASRYFYLYLLIGLGRVGRVTKLKATHRRFVAPQRFVVAANAIDAEPLVTKPIKSKSACFLQLLCLGRSAWNKGICE